MTIALIIVSVLLCGTLCYSAMLNTRISNLENALLKFVTFEYLNMEVKEFNKKIYLVNQRIDELPIDEIIKAAEQEDAYLKGIENIFNYGNNIPSLNVEGFNNG